LERQIEDAFIVKEGEEALDEVTRLFKMKLLRLEKLARMFYAPEEVEAFNKQ
jgi:hypothetical protein